MKKETLDQFEQRVAEFEATPRGPRGPKRIYQPEHITWQLITAGENARARQIAAECKAESCLVEV